MSNTDQAPDPSMEEILASIRRIISDDDAPAEEAGEKAEAPADAPTPEPAPEPEVDDANADIDAMLADMEEESVDESPEMSGFDAVPEEEPAADDDDIFDLTEIAGEEDEEPAVPDTVNNNLVGVDDQDLCFDDVEHKPVAEEPVVPVAPPPAPRPQENLLSPSAAAEASAAFGVLANTILTSSGNARTLEDLVQEMLRPMLKGWLDENLPPLVERLVREEIERVARQGR